MQENALSILPLGRRPLDVSSDDLRYMENAALIFAFS